MYCIYKPTNPLTFQKPPRAQPADPMKWIPVDEDNDERGEPQKGPRQQQTPLTFTKADFENEEEEIDYDEEGKAD